MRLHELVDRQSVSTELVLQNVIRWCCVFDVRVLEVVDDLLVPNYDAGVSVIVT